MARGRDFDPAPATVGVRGTVYLLHFDQPLAHARHYTGWAKDLEARMAAHLGGSGARLTAVVRAAGGGWTLALARSGDRYLERRLKRQGGATRWCPVCRGDADPADLPHYGED